VERRRGRRRHPDAAARRRPQGDRLGVHRGARGRGTAPSAPTAASRCERQGPTASAAADVEALIRLLVLLRERRTDHGWEVVELMRAGHQQKEAAALLDVARPRSARGSRRRCGGQRRTRDPALERLLAELETESGRTATT
jgi:hypothetical protein